MPVRQLFIPGTSCKVWIRTMSDSLVPARYLGSSYISEILSQIASSPVADYYKFGSGHKFLDKVEINIYAGGQPIPYAAGGAKAYCEKLGDGFSRISLEAFDDNYKFEGALSHELGHAWANFAQCLEDNPFSMAFSPMWEKMISLNRTTYRQGQMPWTKDHPHEQFANTFRYFGGALSTRGKSGPGTKDPVVEGFVDPGSNRDFSTLLAALPEASAMARIYGIRTGSIAWDGFWLYFTTAQGVDVRVTARGQWEEKKWLWWPPLSQAWKPSSYAYNV